MSNFRKFEGALYSEFSLCMEYEEVLSIGREERSENVFSKGLVEKISLQITQLSLSNWLLSRGQYKGKEKGFYKSFYTYSIKKITVFETIETLSLMWFWQISLNQEYRVSAVVFLRYFQCGWCFQIWNFSTIGILVLDTFLYGIRNECFDSYINDICYLLVHEWGVCGNETYCTENKISKKFPPIILVGRAGVSNWRGSIWFEQNILLSKKF